MSKLAVVAVCAVGWIGCGHGSDSSAPDASTRATNNAESGGRIIERLSAIAPFAGHLGRGLGLTKHSEGFSASFETSLVAIAPRASDGRLHLRRPGSEADLTVSAIGASSVVGTEVEGAIVYEEAFVDTDIVEVLEGDRAEEIRVLRSAAAPTEARYRVALEGGEVTLEGARVVVRDRSHRPLFETEPMFAVDAQGIRRELVVRVENSESGATIVAKLDTKGLAYPIAVDPIWKSVGTTTARYQHAAALIGGKVLAAGGVDTGSTPITTSIFFDGSAVTAAPSLPSKRQSFTLSPLGATKLVAIGGYSGSAAMSNVDVFDGSAWTSGPGLVNARYSHAASVISSGVVVVTGGYGATSLISAAEQFNGTAWSSAGTLTLARYSHAAVAFKAAGADRVLVVGGYDSGGTPVASAEVWNGATWSTVAPMGTARADLTATLLASGRILVTGGRGTSSYLDSGEVYDPAANTWTAVSNKMASPRAEHSAILLAADTKGRVLVAGGYTTGGAIVGSTDFYNPATNAFVAGPAMNSARTRFTLTAMTPGPGEAARIAAIGGVSGTGTYALFVDLLAPRADGASCAVASDCFAAYCTGGLCCNAAACTAGYTCAGGACATSCTGAGASASCSAGYHCNGAACVADKTNGGTCTAAYDCSSGFCADGVCCNSACSGQCESCSATGVCNPAFGAPKGTRAACVGTGAGTTCGIGCNGVDRTTCHYPDTSVSCGSASCVEGSSGGVETDPGKCNSAGACSAVTKPCGAYKCGASACKIECAGDGDCEGGFHCDGTSKKCIPDLERGKDCSTSAECGKLTCVDLKCCGTSSCASGETCAYPDKAGSCFKKVGSTCASSAECGSNFCVDGVCCDKACTGQCEACDVSDHIGVCTPVSKGDPHGLRSPCDAKSATDCGRSQCDGKATDHCAGFANGGTVSCATDTCTADGRVQAHGGCDGAGGCLLPSPASCAEYACDTTKGACRVDCSSTSDCATGYQCDLPSHKCIQGAHCSTDGTASVDKTGVPTSCAPYTCGTDGTCRSKCVDTTQCVGTSICDVSTGLCNAPEAQIESTGCHHTGAKGTAGLPIIALGLALFAARRRR